MQAFGRSLAGLAVAFICCSSLAQACADEQALPDKMTEATFGPVACRARSLTLCQGDFCSVLFDHRSDETMLFDFAKVTYVNPMLGIEAKTMKRLDREAAKDSYSAKFSIDLGGGPANVKFVANTYKGGPLNMSAAIRFSYPTSGDRPPLVAITAMTCEKAAPMADEH